MKAHKTPITLRVDSSVGLLRKPDIARICNISIRTVDQWIAERKIPTLKIGRTVRFRWPAVEAALVKFERKSIS
jgi:excisionase family DNA binding protein